MKRSLKTLSLLLGYPSPELSAAVPALRQALQAERALPAASLQALEPLLRRLETGAPYDLQEDYSGLFDTSGALSLHLFEHVHGESRDRGQALVDLAQRYADHGLLLEGPELPDYLPLFLEFCAQLPAREARDWLAQPAHVFAALAERLGQRESPYAAVPLALLALARVRPDDAALGEVRQRMTSQEARSLDESWQEQPVSFAAAPAPQAGLGAALRSALGR